MVWSAVVPMRKLDTDFDRPDPQGAIAPLDFRITAIGADIAQDTRPQDARTCQPFGLRRGGASVALARTLGGLAVYLCLAPGCEVVVGLEIRANQLRAVRGARRFGGRHRAAATNRLHHPGVGDSRRERRRPAGARVVADLRDRAANARGGLLTGAGA